MKRRIGLIAMTVALVATFFTACGGSQVTYSNITAESNPYSMGTQSIELVASSSAVINDEPTAKFKQSISPADVELGQALEGKTVTKVVYNSESSVTVTLEGNTKVPGATGGNTVYGTITVKQSGMESKGNSTCIVNVLAPAMVVGDFFIGGNSTLGYSIMATLRLTAGEFTSNATKENITFTGDATGEMSVKLADGSLEIDIENCNVANPTIVLGSAVTSFGKEYAIELVHAGSTLL